MECMDDNPIIEPKELPSPPMVEAESLISAEILQDTSLDGDDDCVICYQILYRPAKTECGHIACESCMLHWALMAMDPNSGASQLTASMAVDGIKFKCPTCRTYTQAKFDAEEDAKLKDRYPTEYATRAEESNSITAEPEDEFATRTMVLMYGNSHRKIPPSFNPETGKTRTHEWTFFVQSSRQDLIQEIEVVLHPTFRQNRLVRLRESPFSTTHKGWGYFTVFAGIQLKEGWQWVDEDLSIDSAEDRKNDKLPIQWLLDFHENGSQRNRIVKFRKVETAVEQEPKEDELDLDGLAAFMSAAEISQYREMRRLKAAAKRNESKRH